MILTCPECATSYSVDDTKIGPAGREVRCAACGTRWHASLNPLELAPAAPSSLPAPPSAPTPAAEAVAVDIEPPQLRVRNTETLPRAYRQRQQAKKDVKRAATTGAVLAGMAVMIAAIIGTAYLFRIDIVQLWPKSSSAYAALRIPVNPLGLEFEDVSARPSLKDGHAALIVAGKIRNTKAAAVESPPLRIELLDKAGKNLAVKIADPENALIPPGEVRHFQVALLDPPLMAEDAEVGFALDRKVARKALTAEAPGAQPVSLRGAVAETLPAPAANAPAPTAGAPAAAIDAKPLPAGSPHAIAPPHGDAH